MNRMQCRAGVLRGWWGGRAGKLLIRQKQSLNECGEMKREGSVPRPAARGGHSQRQRNDLGVGKLSEEKKKNPTKKNPYKPEICDYIPSNFAGYGVNGANCPLKE